MKLAHVAARSEFFDDLGRAVGTWRVAPWLPVASVALTLPTLLPNVVGFNPGAWSIFILPIALFSVGYLGTERLWYRQAWNGAGMTPRDVWEASWAYVGRYLALGLLVVGVGVLVWLPLLLVGLHFYPSSTNFMVSLAVFLIGTDVLATFMTPALAFTTRSATRAIWIGVTILRETWPACTLYVLCPPLALDLAVRLFDVEHGLPFLALSVMTSLLNLAFKGATAAFYLRLHLPEEDVG